ncbi:MAG: GNAT family protein [Reinekea sp.]
MVELKPVLAGDAQPLFALIDKNRAYLRDWLPWLDTVLSLSDCEQFVAQLIKLEKVSMRKTFKICFQQRLAGIIDLREMTRNSAVVGYWLAENQQGKGIASDALLQLINRLKAEQQINRLVLRVESANLASQKVALRCGFKLTERLTDAQRIYERLTDLLIFEQSWQTET